MSKKQQVIDQYKVIAAQAKALLELADAEISYLKSDTFMTDSLLEMIGQRSAGWMEDLGNMINHVDAATEEDEWMDPIFDKAHEMFPQDQGNQVPI
jgi:hypothetical protein